MTLGLKRAGFKVVAAIEIDDLAAETYRMNHPEVRLWESDIRETEPLAILAELGLERGDIALVAGCPPCQGFSSLTTLNGSRKVDDDRNDLVLEYARYVRALRPPAVLMENVPGLATDQRMSNLVDELEGLGYPVRAGTQVLNAVDYGVPQQRRRLVMMAAHGTVVPFAERKSKRRTVREAIGALPSPGASGDALHIVREQRTPRIARLIERIPKDGGGRLDLPAHYQLACHTRMDGFKDVYGRMSWDKPAPTITGGCQNPSKGRFLHPEENRTITLREAALLQGFPPTYKVSLRRGKFAAAELIGNALPPPFVAAHAAVLASLA
jgi:DNA (cytosine-5)-methyltransferase 1